MTPDPRKEEVGKNEGRTDGLEENECGAPQDSVLGHNIFIYILMIFAWCTKKFSKVGETPLCVA